MPTTADNEIRWMIRRDMSQVLAIEEATSEFCAWTEEAFVTALQQRNCIGYVMLEGDTVVGYMLYELQQDAIYLPKLVVASRYRRKGLGRQLVDKLRSKLATRTNPHRNTAQIMLRDSDYQAHRFAKACGFTAISVHREFYEDTGDDGYLFEIRNNKDTETT